jgi:hypothetical protein
MKRLVAETNDAFERSLLSSVRVDAAPEGAARKAGLSLTAAVAQLSTPAVPGSRGPGELSVDSTAFAKAGAFAAWKWLGIGVAIGGIAGAGAVAGLQRAPAPAAAATPTRAAISAVMTAPETGQPREEQPLPRAATSARIKTPPSALKTSASGPGNVAGASSSSAAQVPENASTLAAEAAMIDRARRALAAGSPARSVELLDRYDRESPTHALAPDAQALRVQAEKARGNDAAARKLAEEFLASHPNDPHSERVRRVLESGRPAMTPR